jgi:hypothetical protein
MKYKLSVSKLVSILKSFQKEKLYLDFIRPKPNLNSKVSWKVSDHTKDIVKYYSEYTGYTEDECVEQFLKNILLDKQFIGWIYGKRRNKRVLSKVLLLDQTEELKIGETETTCVT